MIQLWSSDSKIQLLCEEKGGFDFLLVGKQTFFFFFLQVRIIFLQEKAGMQSEARRE